MHDNIPAAAGLTRLSQVASLVWDNWPTVANLATAMNTKPAADGAAFLELLLNPILVHANVTDSKAQDILNATDYATVDLTYLASVLYVLHDDWADNKLSARDDRATTPATVLGANQFAQKFRPNWAQTGTAYAAAGGLLTQLTAVAGDRLTTPSTFVVGTWNITFTKVNTLDRYSFFLPFGPDYQNCYAMNVHHNSTGYYLSKIVADVVTDLIIGTWTNDANPHVLGLTRNGAGDFELFEDAVSKGTVTDNTYTTSSILGFRGQTAWFGQQATWDTLKAV